MNPKSAQLVAWYRAAVHAADPRTRTADAVRALALPGPVGVIGIGKAAGSMVAGALDACGAQIVTGLAVTESETQPASQRVTFLVGDHPVPGERSARAAVAIEQLVPTLRALPDVLVLVSGGTTSLVAAPVAGLTMPQLERLFSALLASGLPIDEMNVVRRRFLRWGAGRLAAALAPARVHCLIVSDVMSGALAAIGSGPCVGDPSTGSDVRAILARVHGVPRTCMEFVDAVTAGRSAETPKPGSDALRHTTARVIFDNRTAVEAVRRLATAQGLRECPAPVPALSGDASVAGRALGAAAAGLGPGEFLVAGGETTVTLPSDHGAGGRCQHLALTAAHEMRGRSVSLLAAGTDGRDGPTDAAGAVVDGDTWGTISRTRDPDDELQRCNAFPALDDAGALIRTGATGTNVNDLVIALA